MTVTRTWRELDLRNAPNEMRERFWSKVAVGGDDECWEWQGYRKPSGYGQFTVKKGHYLTASRASLALSGVVIRANEVACHRCDNPPCVNPAHLFAGTGRVNALDSVRKGRANRASGSNHPSARLDSAQVEAIRAEPARYGLCAELARRYGVSHTAIRRIRAGVTWRNK